MAADHLSDVEELTPEERAAHCRRLAERARRSARSTTDEKLRQSFLQLASGWHALATQYEQSISLNEMMRATNNDHAGGSST